MGFAKKALKGAAIVAGIGACALIIKKISKDSLEGYLTLDDCEEAGVYDDDVATEEDTEPEQIEDIVNETAIYEDNAEENIIQDDANEEASVSEEVDSLDAEDNNEEGSSSEDEK